MPVLVAKQVRQRAHVALIRNAVRETLKMEGVSLSSEVSVVVCDDKFIQQLNRQFMGEDRPTDVLSFPQEEAAVGKSPGVFSSSAAGKALGDIVVSLPTVTQHAQAREAPIQQELVLVIAHATLHLLGYDHASPEAQAEMWQRQDKVVETLMGSM